MLFAVQPSLETAIMAGAGMGVLIGSYVAVNARAKGRMDLAIVAVLGCFVAGAFGGCILALPLAWVLNSWINGLPAGGRRDRSRDHRDGRPIQGGPYTEIGTLVVCNKCRKATSKVNGQVPAECGHCGREFLPDIPKPARTRKPRPDPDEEEEVVDLWKPDDRPRRR